MDEQAERASMEGRIVALEAQVADLTEWLTALSEDVAICDTISLLGQT
jgi:hypothetical protein